MNNDFMVSIKESLHVMGVIILVTCGIFLVMALPFWLIYTAVFYITVDQVTAMMFSFAMCVMFVTLVWSNYSGKQVRRRIAERKAKKGLDNG